MNRTEYTRSAEQRISGVEEIDHNVFILSFERKFDFYPGQIIAISMVENDPAPRLYSICSGAGDSEISILFNVVPGGKLTSAMASLKKGDVIYSSLPYGRFRIKDEPAVWIATGTGIAPFISKLRSGLKAESTLIHGGRHKSSFYFNDQLQNHDSLNYLRCSTQVNENGYFSGRVTEYLSSIDLPGNNRRYYLCGSTEMVVEARDILISKGIDYNNIESEIYF